MRRVILAIAGTAVALVMLLSFKTHSVTSQAAQSPVVASTPSASAAPSVSAPSASSSTAAAPSTAATTKAPATTTKKTVTPATKTVTGDAEDTRYGPVQVKVTVTNGKVTAIDAVEYPQNSPKDQQINSYAIPQLDQEVLAAGNAAIDMVSGATFTSDGYIRSLQSALNKAGVAS
ncbi:hypothetical protein acdb102_24730 [Acidothermaceae bacterium B102]|nr:hypothetical protein acdb102_24730 [Acidothermaceae bacterium B102]